MTRNLLLFLVLAVVVPVPKVQGQRQRAAAAPAAPATSTPGMPVPSETSFLKITINPSRSPITMDTEAGISAEIKNVSSVPVQLFENETVFMTMPETRLYGESRPSIQGCATFPTQGNVRGPERSRRGYDLIIQPGDTYRVFWDTSRNGCTGEAQQSIQFWTRPLTWINDKWRKMMFTPGTYKVYLDVVIYPEGEQPYHVTTGEHDVVVSASQQMVLFGAFLGGLLAYLVKLYYGVETELTARMEDALPKRIIEKTEWLVAGLFAAAMVILASRLSDTFPVQINATDFWGAITLGFIFQWVGVRLLAKLPGMNPAANHAAPHPLPERRLPPAQA